MSAPELRVIDLFAGAGGLSQGLAAQRRFRTICAVEQSPQAAATYQANHPEVELFCGDIANWLDGPVPGADLVVGGPPCQGFSNLGARQVRDPRNALWRRYVDTLDRVRPLYFVLENVADFLRSGQFRDLRRETHRSGRLPEYRLQWQVLNAADFGVPQVRRRAVVIGSRRDLPAPGIPAGQFAGDRQRWATVASSISDLDETVELVDLPQARTTFEGVRYPGLFKTVELHVGRRPTELSLQRYATIPAGGNRRDIPQHLLPACWRQHQSGSGDVMGRLHWDRPSVTIRTEFWKPEKGRYLHPTADRAITHHEAARLQGFPDDYLWCGSKAEIGRQIGNAVPVRLAEAVAGHLAQQFV